MPPASCWLAESEAQSASYTLVTRGGLPLCATRREMTAPAITADDKRSMAVARNTPDCKAFIEWLQEAMAPEDCTGLHQEHIDRLTASVQALYTIPTDDPRDTGFIHLQTKTFLKIVAACSGNAGANMGPFINQEVLGAISAQIWDMFASGRMPMTSSQYENHLHAMEGFCAAETARADAAQMEAERLKERIKYLEAQMNGGGGASPPSLVSAGMRSSNDSVGSLLPAGFVEGDSWVWN